MERKPSESSLSWPGWRHARTKQAVGLVSASNQLKPRFHDEGSGTRRACALLGIAILLGILTSCGRMARADPTTQDTYALTMTVEPAPPAVGPSTLTVTLKDQAGQPVDGARLEIEANMSHAGMVPVLAGTAESHAGLYRVPLQWTMAGDWTVDLKFALPDGSLVVRRYPVGVK